MKKVNPKLFGEYWFTYQDERHRFGFFKCTENPENFGGTWRTGYTETNWCFFNEEGKYLTGQATAYIEKGKTWEIDYMPDCYDLLEKLKHKKGKWHRCYLTSEGWSTTNVTVEDIAGPGKAYRDGDQIKFKLESVCFTYDYEQEEFTSNSCAVPEEVNIPPIHLFDDLVECDIELLANGNILIYET